MRFTELASFEVAHAQLAWPWIAFDPTGTRFAFPSSAGRIATRALDGAAVVEGPSFTLPEGLSLPVTPPPADRARTDAGLHGFALDPAGALLAAIGIAGGGGVLVTLDAGGELRRTPFAALVGDGEERLWPRAVTFDRQGTRLWISAESDAHTVVVFVDARTHAVLGSARSAPFPPPSAHELHVHPVDDAILLLAACGQDGTFARIVGWSGDAVESVPSALDEGATPAGFVGFSADRARVHLVEADALRTHAWPGLHELSSVELKGDFVASYAGAVLGDRVLVDGEDSDAGEDAVMSFDRSALLGSILSGPVPSGMWAGRLGADVIVTVAAKGDPACGGVVRLDVAEPPSARARARMN
jgi:hypothetical protein